MRQRYVADRGGNESLKIAAGYNRKFAYQKWSLADGSAYKRAKDEAEQIRVDRPLNVIGADVSEKAIEIAKFHAKQAGVEKYIKFNVRKAQEFVSHQSFRRKRQQPSVRRAAWRR